MCTELSTLGATLDSIELLNLESRIDEITQRLDEAEDDNMRNLTHLSNKIKEASVAQASAIASSSSERSHPPIGFDTPIIDSNGGQLGCIGAMLSEISTLRAENASVKSRLDALQADLAAGGGVVFGRHTFTSEQHVMETVMAECPQGDAFSLFVDPLSIFCHDGMYQPHSGWQKETKAMESSGFMSKTDRKVVTSFDVNNSYWYTEGKGTTAGLKLAAFSSAEKWTGAGGMIGRKHEIENSLQAASDPIRGGIEHKLPAGGNLAQVAPRMVERTNLWIHAVHRHLDEELGKLTQMGIPEGEVLVLLSEEIIIMFERFHAIRRKRFDFTVQGAGVEYMVRCVWLPLQVHAEMDSFVKNGLTESPALSAAFVRFLTAQTATNVGAGVGSHLSKLEDKLKSLENSVKEATKESKEASKRAATAGTNADTVKTSLKQLYEKNSTLKK